MIKILTERDSLICLPQRAGRSLGRMTDIIKSHGTYFLSLFEQDVFILLAVI